MTKKIIVTGGSGGAGAYVVQELVSHGYQVLNLDRSEPREDHAPWRETDLADYGEVRDAMEGADAVVAFAADPEPDFDFDTGAARFHNNTLCTYNVMNAACALGLESVVWASSETVLGFPFDDNQPLRVPVREDDPLQPQNSYSLSKVLCEELARRLNALHGIPMIALRLSNVLFTDRDHPANYAAIPGYWGDPWSRKFNLWGYIDARDAARGARLALESDVTGAEAYIVSAADTIMMQDNATLMAAVFPDVEIDPELGPYETLLSIDKAAKDFGWAPQHSWRTVLRREDLQPA